MATETPLIHDGGQMVVPANYYNPGSALAGPGGSAQFLGVTISASRTVSVQTTIGGQIYGVLQNTPPAANEAADVGILGVSKVVAGASITAGAELMVDASGRFITWVAGSGYFKVGQALETTSAANNLLSVLLYSPNYKVVT
jgi:hypothetical protein